MDIKSKVVERHGERIRVYYYMNGNAEVECTEHGFPVSKPFGQNFPDRIIILVGIILVGLFLYGEFTGSNQL